MDFLFKFRFFFSFFLHTNQSTSKNTKKSVFFKKLLVHSKFPLNYFTERLLVICGLDAISFSLNSYCGTHAEDPEHKNQV